MIVVTEIDILKFNDGITLILILNIALNVVLGITLGTVLASICNFICVFICAVASLDDHSLFLL